MEPLKEIATPNSRALLSPDLVSLAASELLRHPGSLERQLDDVQREMDGLRAEVNLLRRRDETLNFYMNRLDEELRLAARLQQDFLPKSLPEVGAVRFHTLFRPAGYVSGDLYDVMRLDEHRVGFYIADAVGHGMPAALLTMFIKQALKTKDISNGGYRLLRPSEALAGLNEALVEQNLSQASFATALYGMIDCSTLQMTFARAGHPHPMLLGATGLRTLETDGSLLGIFPSERFIDCTVQLEPGDRLFVYTDGIEVAFSDDQTIDSQRWREELLRNRDQPTQDILTQFSQRVDAEAGSLEPKDDLTVVIAEVLG